MVDASHVAVNKDFRHTDRPLYRVPCKRLTNTLPGSIFASANEALRMRRGGQ